MRTETLLTQFEAILAQTQLSDEFRLVLGEKRQISSSEGVDLSKTLNLPPYKRFFDVSEAQLQALRQASNHESAHQYAHGMLRFLEVNHPKLAAKTRELLPTASKNEIALRYKMALVFLLDYYDQSHDIRFLNAVLKAMNYEWICSPSELTPKNLTRNALYTYQLLTQIERALRQLSAQS
jgi:hypothetical protein